jgi:hypothetical protein
MSDLLHQNLATVQSNQQPPPVTLVAAATISPTTFITFLAGTTAIAQIVPPVTGQHMICIITTTTNWAGAVTTGNILVASITNSVLWANKASFFVYNPLNGKYYPNYGTAT